MKLFYFNPNGYGEEYIIMSPSKEEAFYKVKEYIKGKFEKYVKEHGESLDFEFERWKDATIDNLPESYSIDEYEKDIVIETYYG